MARPISFQYVCLAAVLCAVLQVHAESFTSSALSAGSASSGSEDLGERAQELLRQTHYTPDVVRVSSPGEGDLVVPL